MHAYMLILYIIINWGIIKEMQIYLIQRSLSILKSCIQVALYGLNRLYFGIYIYTSTFIWACGLYLGLEMNIHISMQ